MTCLKTALSMVLDRNGRRETGRLCVCFFSACLLSGAPGGEAVDCRLFCFYGCSSWLSGFSFCSVSSFLVPRSGSALLHVSRVDGSRTQMQTRMEARRVNLKDLFTREKPKIIAVLEKN